MRIDLIGYEPHTLSLSHFDVFSSINTTKSEAYSFTSIMTVAETLNLPHASSCEMFQYCDFT